MCKIFRSLKCRVELAVGVEEWIRASVWSDLQLFASTVEDDLVYHRGNMNSNMYSATNLSAADATADLRAASARDPG